MSPILIAISIVVLVVVVARIDNARSRTLVEVGLSEAAVADRLHPHTGHVEASPQRAPESEGIDGR